VLRRRERRAAQAAVAAGRPLALVTDFGLLAAVQRILMDWGVDPALYATLDPGTLGKLLEAGLEQLAPKSSGARLPVNWWVPELDRIINGSRQTQPEPR
jgi:hypothetical protein